MKRLVLACGIAVVAVLAGCPPKRGPGGPLPEGVGCPPASGVHIAVFQADDDAGEGSGSAAPQVKGNWALPLADKIVATLDGMPPHQTLDAAAASAAGVPAPPSSIWLLTPGSAAPCRATIGPYYAATVDEGKPNITYGVELVGCPSPQDPNATAIALVSDAMPGECKAVAPRQLASRMGEVDKDGKWQRPLAGLETAIPAAIAGAIPPRECTAPACEKLYAVGQVEVAGKPIAYGVAVNYMTTGGSSEPCDWKGDTFSGFFVAAANGAPTRVTEGQDHPLALTAVLADKGGAKVLIAEGPGEYTTYSLDGGTAKVARHLVWYLPDPGAYAIDRLGPDCSQGH